jgi:Arc/MetJ-type ribon-helix-helix transcriptional regulator
MMTWYDAAMRTIVDLPEDQIQRLRDYCEREHVSRAEAVRRGVETLLAQTKREETTRILKEAFGSWKHLGIDADTYVRGIRAEWDREWDK